MTPEQKVALLKEAGVWDVIGFPGCMDKLIALVAAHEREMCAKLMEDMAAQDRVTNYYKVAANAIRTRGEK